MNIVPITIWREARSESTQGMLGVYNVIMNRSAASPRNGWPVDPEEICLQSYQFSCWNSSDPQRNLYPSETDKAYGVALAILVHPGADNTEGATAYFDISIPQPREADGKKIISIGRLRFYQV